MTSQQAQVASPSNFYQRESHGSERPQRSSTDEDKVMTSHPAQAARGNLYQRESHGSERVEQGLCVLIGGVIGIRYACEKSQIVSIK